MACGDDDLARGMTPIRWPPFARYQQQVYYSAEAYLFCTRSGKPLYTTRSVTGDYRTR